MLFSNKIFAFKWIFLNLYCSYIFISFLSSVIFESSFEVFIPFPTVWNLTRLMQAYHDFVIGMRFSKGLKMLGCYTIYCHWNAIWLPCKTSICSRFDQWKNGNFTREVLSFKTIVAVEPRSVKKVTLPKIPSFQVLAFCWWSEVTTVA